MENNPAKRQLEMVACFFANNKRLALLMEQEASLVNTIVPQNGQSFELFPKPGWF
jgi:hypothetical protein